MSESNKIRKNPNECHPLTDDEYKYFNPKQKEHAKNQVRIGPKGYMDMMNLYQTHGNDIYNFEIKKDDVWVVSLPRSGTTLTQEMVWQISNNLDFVTGFKTPLIERFPFFEMSAGPLERLSKLLEDFKDEPEKIKTINKLFTPLWKQPRDSLPKFFKSHFPLSLLPPELLTSGCKVVYVARNPKDNAVSRYNFHKSLGRLRHDTFEEYWDHTEKGLHPCLPFFEHVLEGWDNRNNENLLFLFYEDIVTDTKDAIKNVAKFLGKTLTEDQVEKLADHLKVENFKKNDSVNKDYNDYFKNPNACFIRKGKVGSWKEEYFTPELSARADKWIEEQYNKTDLRFPNIN